MATTCPNCGTDNRPFAKYCIECVAVLPSTFAPTVFLSRSGTASAAPASATRLAAASHVSTAPMPPRAVDTPVARDTTMSARAATPAPAARKGLWIGVVAFAIALAIGAGGWLAGAEGWFSDNAPSTSPASSTPVEPAAAVAVPAPLPTSSDAASAEPVTAVAPMPTAPTPVPDAAAVLLPSIASARPALKASSGGSARAPATAAATAPRESKSRSVATTPLERAVNPADLCTGLGFFGTSRCMAEQCAKPAYTAHATCDGIRRQQQLMEEKRNPSLTR